MDDINQHVPQVKIPVKAAQDQSVKNGQPVFKIRKHFRFKFGISSTEKYASYILGLIQAEKSSVLNVFFIFLFLPVDLYEGQRSKLQRAEYVDIPVSIIMSCRYA